MKIFYTIYNDKRNVARGSEKIQFVQKLKQIKTNTTTIQGR